MRRIFRALTALFLCLFLLLTAPFSFLSNIVSADEEPQYAFAGATYDGVGYIIDADGNYQSIDGFFFCANIEREPPTLDPNYTFSRSSLSDQQLTADQKSMIVAIQQNADNIENFVRDKIGFDNNTPEGSFCDYYINDVQTQGRKYITQYLIWIVLNENEFKTGSSPSGYIASQNTFNDGTGTDYVNPDSLWSKVFQPLLDYINSPEVNWGQYVVGTGEGEWNAEYYICSDGRFQNMLGWASQNPTSDTTPSESSESSEATETTTESSAETTVVTETTTESSAETTVVTETTTESSEETTVVTTEGSASSETNVPFSDGGSSSAETTVVTETTQTVETTVSTESAVTTETTVVSDSDVDSAGRNTGSSSVPATGEAEAYDLITIGLSMIASSPLAFYGSTKFKDRIKRRKI